MHQAPKVSHMGGGGCYNSISSEFQEHIGSEKLVKRRDCHKSSTVSMILGASVPLCCGVLFPCWVLRHVRAQYQCYCRRHGQSDKRNVCGRKNSYASPKSPVLIKSSSSTLLYPSLFWNDAETGYRVVTPYMRHVFFEQLLRIGLVLIDQCFCKILYM